MTIQTYLADNWIGILVIAVLLFIATIVMAMINKKKKGHTKHKWEPLGSHVYKDKLRMISFCKICGTSVHTPIYTLKKLEALET